MRFLKVRIPAGLCVVGRSIGKALSARVPVENFNVEAGSMLRKRPVATRAARAGMVWVQIVARG